MDFGEVCLLTLEAQQEAARWNPCPFGGVLLHSSSQPQKSAQGWGRSGNEAENGQPLV
jgi:hypothetical protein